MNNINRSLKLKNMKDEKVLMFGEGNFLRAFIGFIFQKMNDSKCFNGGITALQGVENGLCDLINQQQGLYTVIERGIEKGETIERFTLIDCFNKCINPYKDYDKYLEIAKNSQLQVIVSNTTEFGICYSENEGKEIIEHKNFPAKLTDFLYKRYKYFNGNKDKGLIILPCELIDRNGDKLKDLILKYSKEWDLESDFIKWLNESNTFTNTLVDRIVSGYPKAEADEICNKLEYKDNLLDVCEPFLLWVIEGDKKILNKLPLDKCGLDIVITDNLETYRTRKVRILNGAHTMSVLAGHLCGFEFVEQLVNDDMFNKYIKKGIFEEIIPAMNGEKLNEYALDVIERFKNPYLNHRLLNISLNSISKFKSRVLVSIKDYVLKFNKAPKVLSFSLAALISFYKKGIGSFVNDDAEFLDRLSNLFKNCKNEKELINNILSDKILWGEDLTLLKDFEAQVLSYYIDIQSYGTEVVIKGLIND